jgi:hypothetical protein
VRWILRPPFRSYRQAGVSHCGPLQPGWMSAAFLAARGGKWSAVQVARLLEAVAAANDVCGLHHQMLQALFVGERPGGRGAVIENDVLKRESPRASPQNRVHAANDRECGKRG